MAVSLEKINCSGRTIYGSPRIFCDMREAGVACGENRVARLMHAAQVKSVRGYKRPRYKVGKPSLVAPNQLQRQFQNDEPDLAWVTDRSGSANLNR
jgi:putative transposase